MTSIITSETLITDESFSYFISHLNADFNTYSDTTIISAADYLNIRAIDCEIFLSSLMIKNSLADINSDFSALSYYSC